MSHSTRSQHTPFSVKRGLAVTDDVWANIAGGREREGFSRVAVMPDPVSTAPVVLEPAVPEFPQSQITTHQIPAQDGQPPIRLMIAEALQDVLRQKSENQVIYNGVPIFEAYEAAYTEDDKQQCRMENPDLARVTSSLLTLVQQQRRENERASRPCVVNGQTPDENALAAVYRYDQRVVDIVDEFRVRKPFAAISTSKLRIMADSSLLELVAYDQTLKGMNSADVTVLDSDRTCEFYKVRYPKSFKPNDVFGLSGLIGVSVPDFLIVKDDAIQAIVETTFHSKYRYFQRKHKAHFGAVNNALHAELFKGAKLIFLVPEGFPEERRLEIETTLPGTEVRVMEGIRSDDVNNILDYFGIPSNKTAGKPI